MMVVETSGRLDVSTIIIRLHHDVDQQSSRVADWKPCHLEIIGRGDVVGVDSRNTIGCCNLYMYRLQQLGISEEIPYIGDFLRNTKWFLLRCMWYQMVYGTCIWVYVVAISDFANPIG
eukprot:jgi/Botrbrau1/11608/Bobra.247_1s0022.1